MSNTMCEASDYTGKYVKIVDRAGHVWFHGKAVERVGAQAYRFAVLKIGGKTLEVELVANVRELTLAAVA